MLSPPSPPDLRARIQGTIKSIFTLCSGLVQMFAKIAEHHR
jgi:hypothetical protein